MTKNELAAERNKYIERAAALETALQTRALTEDENREVDTIHAKMLELAKLIEQYTKVEEMANQKAPEETPVEARRINTFRKGEEQRVRERFSVGRAIRMARGQVSVSEDTGVEREMSQEGERIARASGLPIQGGGESIFLPDAIFRSGTTAPLDAGNLVPTNQRPVSDGYRPALFLEKLGANVETAAPGRNNIPVSDFIAEAGFVGEASMTPVAVAANVRRAELTAKAIYAEVTSNWYLHATAPESDQVLLRTLLQAEATTLNKNIITRGAGTVASKGLLEMDDVIEVTGANGTALTRDLLVKMLNSPSNENATFDGPAFILSPTLRERLQNMKVDAGSGLYVWDLDKPEMLLGHNAAVTTLMPTNLEKGTAPNTKQGAVFGHFSELVILRWPVRQIIVNPYNDAGPKTKVISFYDWAAKNPKAFARAFFTAS